MSKKLEQIAYNILYAVEAKGLPINVYDVAKKLNIKIATYESMKKYGIDELSAEKEKKNILFFAGNEFIICYDENIKNCDYIIAKEISLYLLMAAEYKNPTEEQIELLTVFLLCPPTILNQLKIINISEISLICKIPPHIIKFYLPSIFDSPIDLKCRYTEQIQSNFSEFIKFINRKSIVEIIQEKTINWGVNYIENEISNSENLTAKTVEEAQQAYNNWHQVYVDSNTMQYHEYNCRCIRDKIDIDVSSIYNAEQSGFTPCSDCIK